MSEPFLTLPSIDYRDSFMAGLREFHAEGRQTDWVEAVVAADFESFIGSLLARKQMRHDLLVPESYFWVVADGEYAGRIGIRHYLNDRLRVWGGHIGYEIRPSMRRRGIGTAACRLGLIEARRLGIKRVLITCNDDNLASARIIERNGGVLENIVPYEDGEPKRRYWVDLRTELERQPRVGAGALIVEAGQALLLLRRRPPGAGMWSITGGKVEFMETVEATAIREAQEEAGVEVRLQRLLTVVNDIWPEAGEHWVSSVFLARITGGTVQNCEPDKAHEVRWFGLDALPDNLTLTASAALALYTNRNQEG